MFGSRDFAVTGISTLQPGVQPGLHPGREPKQVGLEEQERWEFLAPRRAGTLEVAVGNGGSH